jgi:hypothetical protein
VRRWIESGAPREGVVPGTGELLQACLPPPEPIEIEPLPEPAPNEGVQIKMPRWELAAHSERETCFASFYDVTDRVPEEFRTPNGDGFFYKRAVVRQDPLSHHLIVERYAGADLPDDPADWPPRRCDGGEKRGARCGDDADCTGAGCVSVWPEFFCRGGARDGEVCNPLRPEECGENAPCVTDVSTSVGCVGFGPPDAGLGLNSAGFIGAQETATVVEFADGVFDELPLRAMVFWNSHAFNLTDEPGKLEAWLNFSFAAADERRFAARTIFDTSAIFAPQTPPFRAEEICNHHVLPEGAQLFELSSHTHRHGKRFRTFRGAWRCEGGPRAGAACSPTGPDLTRDTPDLCAGFPCRALAEPRAGDCDEDGRVTVAEIILALNVALARRPAGACRGADPDGDGAVRVDELLLAVGAALQPLRDAEESLLYVNLVYNDPPRVRFRPPLSFPGAGSAPERRTLTYCALYDNGFGAAADEVKRRSTSPQPPLAVPLGGPCAAGEACVNEGRVGNPCDGASDAERNASCDSVAGAGDGLCDACTLAGGLTTEDEMFILMGRFFVVD